LIHSNKAKRELVREMKSSDLINFKTRKLLFTRFDGETNCSQLIRNQGQMWGILQQGINSAKTLANRVSARPSISGDPNIPPLPRINSAGPPDAEDAEAKRYPDNTISELKSLNEGEEQRYRDAATALALELLQTASNHA
jgi:hypothetical protein